MHFKLVHRVFITSVVIGNIATAVIHVNILAINVVVLAVAITSYSYCFQLRTTQDTECSRNVYYSQAIYISVHIKNIA